MINEISILKTLKHQFIVQMYDFHYDTNYIYMVLEYCPGGELASLMNLKRKFPEDIVQHFVQQLATALKFLRQNNICHMDLKPQNILVSGILFINLYHELNTFNVWRNVVLKIADFGFSQYLSLEQHSNAIRGSPLYMAPEVLLGQEYDARVDLWSIGIILYECLFGHPPYQKYGMQDMVQLFTSNKKYRPPIQIEAKKNKLSQDCVNLLERLIEVNPKKRITFDQFFQHSWIDLEHMPSAESEQKASQVLAQAIQDDENNKATEAFYKYREALNYLMPLYKWGVLSVPYSKNKQDRLRLQIVKYIERAEYLLTKSNCPTVEEADKDVIQNVYDLIDQARADEENELHADALQNYKKAIEQALAILVKYKHIPMIKNDFFGDISAWMSEAEHVSELADSNSIPRKSENNQKSDLSARTRSLKMNTNLKDGDCIEALSLIADTSKSLSNPSSKRPTNLPDASTQQRPNMIRRYFTRQPRPTDIIPSDTIANADKSSNPNCGIQ